MAFVIRNTISQTFLDRVRATPDQIAFQYKVQEIWREVSFQNFYDEVRILSYGLMNLGAEAQDKIALLCSTRFEWSLSDLAILGARGVTVPIYTSGTGDDIAYILNHSEAKFLIVENAAQLQKILDYRKSHPGGLACLKQIITIEASALLITLSDPQSSKDVLTLQALNEIGRREEARDPAKFVQNLEAASPGDLLTICYTSGTTGVPKGAMITHDNMVSVLHDGISIVEQFLNAENEVILSFLPFSHVLGKFESLSLYVYGWKNAFAESAEQLMKNMEEVSPSVLFVVPRVFEKAFARINSMLDEGSLIKRKVFETALHVGERYFEAIWEGKAPSWVDAAEYQVAKATFFKKIHDRFGGKLKIAVCGGAPLSPEIAKFFQIIGVQILEGYGLTETTAPVTFNTPASYKYGTVGKPLAEVNMKIADDGEILVKSRKVFRGYFKDPEESARALNEGWLHTGDIGNFDAEGFLKITDRKKDLIITSGGKNIAPQKIENLARLDPFITQFVVHGDKRNFLSALVTLDRESVIRYASENQILFSGYHELIKHAKIIHIVQKTIDGVNEKLASFETIKKFVIVPDEFSIESGELTPSLKVKRAVIAKRYKSELDHLY